VDAQGFQPQLNSGVATLQTPITNTVASSFNRVGALTDGASLIVVQLSSNPCSYANWTLGITDTTPGSTNGAAQLGSLWDDSYDSDNLPDLPATLADPGNTNVTLNVNTRAIFYRPPPSWAFGKKSKEHNIQIELRNPSNDVVTTQTLNLHKPPLVLMHGGLSSGAKWNNFQSVLDARNIEVDLVEPFVDYSTNNFSGLDVIYRVLPRAISNAVQALRAQQIAATRLDIVAHSAGGLAARWYMTPVSQRITGERIDPTMALTTTHGDQVLPLKFKAKAIHDDAQNEFRRADNFGVGDIRRLITLGTPHRGMTLWRQAIAFFNKSVDHKLYMRRQHMATGNALESLSGVRIIPLGDPDNVPDQGMMILDLAAFYDFDYGVGKVSRVIDSLPTVPIPYAPIEGIADGGPPLWPLGDLLEQFVTLLMKLVLGTQPADLVATNSDLIVPEASARNMNPVVSELRLNGRNHIQLGSITPDPELGAAMERLLGPDEEFYYTP